MQPLILVIYLDHEENLRSEVIELHFDLHELKKIISNKPGNICVYHMNIVFI